MVPFIFALLFAAACGALAFAILSGPTAADSARALRVHDRPRSIPELGEVGAVDPRRCPCCREVARLVDTGQVHRVRDMLNRWRLPTSKRGRLTYERRRK